jgi:hypothetical protein
MQTTVVQKRKRFDHDQWRWAALILGVIGILAIGAVALVLARTGEDTDQSRTLIVTTTSPFSETLDKGMLSPSVGQRDQDEVMRREGLQTAAPVSGELFLPEYGDGIIPGTGVERAEAPSAVGVIEYYLPEYGDGIIPGTGVDPYFSNEQTEDARPGFSTDGRFIP